MTYRLNTRAPALAGLAAAILAIGAGTAVSKGPSEAPTPTRTAVLAGADATPAALASAERIAGVDALVRHTGGPQEAQAQAAALAAAGYDRVIPAGAQARAAVGQAASSELPKTAGWTDR
jgi:hypothetical protein